MTAIDRVIQALDARDANPRGSGTTWTARCPAHEDRNASLSIGQGNEGRALLHCHAGCAVADILDAIGLDFPDLFDGDAPKPWTSNGLRRTGAIVHQNGRVQLGGVAYLPGAANSEKARAASGVPRDLWPAPETIGGATLYVVEGEPDAQTASEIGLPATGVPGASKWTAAFADRIAAGRDMVVVLADSDEPGRLAAAKWVADLGQRCPDVRMVDLHPDRNDGSDLSTFVADASSPEERVQAAAVIARIVEAAAPIDTAGETVAGSLTQRLADSRVDLLAILDGRTPEREWLPCSAHMLARGARHHVAAPLKSGKSLAFLTHTVNMVEDGARVAILDRENGGDEYARRLRDILADRSPAAREAIRDRLAYHAFPTLKLTDGELLAEAFRTVDLVILDSTRTFLSSLALDEDRSDDFATFATAIIEPLFRAGVTTLQLDNTGHGDTGRARGSSTKGDLADVLYALKTTSAFDQHRAGAVRLTRTHARFGDIAPAFVMTLGGGAFGTFASDEQAAETDGTERPPFRPTALMERVSLALEATPGLGKRSIRSGVSGKNEYIDLALDVLIAEGHVAAQHDGQAIRHEVVNPFREANDTDRAPVPQPCPDRAPGTVNGDRAPVPLPIGHGARGTANAKAA